MRTIATQVYTFDELSKDAQQKAIEDHREFLSQDWNPEFLLDEWKTKLTDLGYEQPTISYSGFYSQGDGASFTATIDIAQWLKAHKLANKYRLVYAHAEYVIALVERTQSMYVHENTITATVETDNYSGKLETQLDELREAIQAEARTLSKDIYAELEDLYNSDTSDEIVADNIRANDYEYYASGELI